MPSSAFVMLSILTRTQCATACEWAEAMTSAGVRRDYTSPDTDEDPWSQWYRTTKSAVHSGLPVEGGSMLHYAVVFFVIALVASVLGFGGIAGLSAQIGWIFAVVALVFLAIALLRRSGRGPIAIP